MLSTEVSSGGVHNGYTGVWLYCPPDQRKIPLHLFTIGFQKPGICADSWFLESNGKKVQWDFSLIINRAPHGNTFLATGLYILLPVIRINLQVLTGRWDDLFSSGIGFWNWIWRHRNGTRGARFMIREKSRCTFFSPLDSRNQESAQGGQKCPAPCGARFMIREKSHCTFLPLDSRNQESAQIPGFWNPMV